MSIELLVRRAIVSGVLALMAWSASAVPLCGEEPADEAAQSIAADAQSAPAEAVEPANVPANGATDAATEAGADLVMDVLNRFPKLIHYLALHQDGLPAAMQDQMRELFRIRYIIIMYKAAFEPTARMNPAGKLVALKLVEDDQMLLLKTHDRLKIVVTVVQASTGAEASGTWIAGNPEILRKPDTVLTHAKPGHKFQAGPATASAVLQHLDGDNNVIDTRTWSRTVELQPINE